MPEKIEKAKSGKSGLAALKRMVMKVFDRSDERVATAQDLTLNVVLFGAAIFAIHTYGHKLAV